MKWKKEDLVKLKIVDLAFGGAGVGEILGIEERFVVFVEGVTVGEEVLVKLTKIYPNYGEGRVVEILEKGKDRIEPRCIHFGEKVEIVEFSGKKKLKFDKTKNCGGCTWQHISYQKQLEYKKKQVEDCLRKIAGVENVQVMPIIGLKNPWEYRNKMEFSFGLIDGKVRLGLHMKGRYFDVIDQKECYLMRQDFFKLLVKINKWLEESVIGEKCIEWVKSQNLKSLIMRCGINSGERMLILVTENLIEGEIDEKLKKILDKLINLISGDEKCSVILENHINVKGKSKKREIFLLKGKGVLNEWLNLDRGVRLNFMIKPNAFFQPNTLQSEVLYRKVIEFCDVSNKDEVLDLCCGTGTIAIAVSKFAKKVIGVDIEKQSIDSAMENAILNDCNNVEFICGDIRKVLLNNEIKADVVVLDPPRAGVHPEALEVISKFKPKKIIYVSCNPATWARDVSLLNKNGFKILKVQPIDQFAQTAHIELVSLLVLKS